MQLVRAVSLWCLLGSLACLGLLHVLRPELDPVDRQLSEYALGSYRLLMTAVFLAMALALLAMALLVRRRGGIAGPSAWLPALLVVAAAGLVLAGAFPTGSDSVAVEVVHSRASGASVLSLTAAAVLGSIRPPAALAGRVPAAAQVAAAVAAVAVLVSPLLDETRWSGLSQRVVWLALGSWVLATAWRLDPSAPLPPSPDGPAGRSTAGSRTPVDPDEIGPA